MNKEAFTSQGSICKHSQAKISQENNHKPRSHKKTFTRQAFLFEGKFSKNEVVREKKKVIHFLYKFIIQLTKQLLDQQTEATAAATTATTAVAVTAATAAATAPAATVAVAVEPELIIAILRVDRIRAAHNCRWGSLLYNCRSGLFSFL